MLSSSSSSSSNTDAKAASSQQHSLLRPRRSARPRVRMASHQHRVLIYVTCYNVLDGVTLTIRKLEREILDAGHSVCILTTRSGDMSQTHKLVPQHPNRRVLFVDNSVPIPFINDPNQPEVSYQLGFSLSRAVQEELEAFEPSVVHITCPDCTALHVIQLARRREWPIVGTYHSNIPDYMDHYPGLTWLKHILAKFLLFQYSFLQGLYVPTPFIRQYLNSQYQMDQATSVRVWGRGVDTTHYHPDHRSEKFRSAIFNSANSSRTNRDTPLFLWVGRLVPEKRVDIFCDTVRRLAAAQVDFHALVVGSGPSQDVVQDLPNTTFAGWMDADQLAVAYASADVFLFPSSVETFGNVTLEAMASGLPVIVDAGCSGHLVQDGRNGFAIATPTKATTTLSSSDAYSDEATVAEAYYQASLRLLTDASLRHAYSCGSREMAETMEQHSVVRQMLDHYSTVTDEFYMEYDGHHARRDDLWSLQHPEGSFPAGNNPRPLLVVLLEYLFIVLCHVIWNMTSMFMYVQSSLIQRQHRRQQSSSSSSSAEWKSAVPTVDPTRENTVLSDMLSVILEDAPTHCSSNSFASSGSSRSSSPLHSKRKGLSPRTKLSGVVGGNKPIDENRTALIELDSIDLEQELVGATNPTLLHPLKTTPSRCGEDHDEDEATHTTACTQDSATESASSTSTTRKKVACGDCQLSHSLAKSFVRSMAFQMRTESRLRNSVKSSWGWWRSHSSSSSAVGPTTSFLPGKSSVSRKRKNSSFAQSAETPPSQRNSSRFNSKRSTVATRRGRMLLDTDDDDIAALL